MAERAKNAWATLLVYKLAITRFCLFVLGTTCASIQASLAGAQWGTLNGQQKFLIVVGVIGAVCTTIGAFFDKTISRLSQGENPFGTTPPIPPTQ